MKKGSLMLGYQPHRGKVNFFRQVLISPQVRREDMDFLLDEIDLLGRDMQLWLLIPQRHRSCPGGLQIQGIWGHIGDCSPSGEKQETCHILAQQNQNAKQVVLRTIQLPGCYCCNEGFSHRSSLGQSLGESLVSTTWALDSKLSFLLKEHRNQWVKAVVLTV